MAFIRKRNLFDPLATEPFRLSRSKVELFTQCPHCFYLDRRLGVSQPPGFPFNLNSAVDHLLKKEFDLYRIAAKPHPLMERNGINAIPYAHEMLDEWRENFKGVQHHHGSTNFLLTGAVDDLWVNPAGELIVVDYKSTSKDSGVSIDAEWQGGYKRQMEFYQWLLRRNGFDVSATGYFVYCNGKRDRDAFDHRLEFDISVIPYIGDDSWVEPVLQRIRTTLAASRPPEPSKSCDYCSYRRSAHDALL